MRRGAAPGFYARAGMDFGLPQLHCGSPVVLIAFSFEFRHPVTPWPERSQRPAGPSRRPWAQVWEGRRFGSFGPVTLRSLSGHRANRQSCFRFVWLMAKALQHGDCAPADLSTRLQNTSANMQIQLNYAADVNPKPDP